MTAIRSFVGEYGYLHNNFRCDVAYQDRRFGSVTHAYNTIKNEREKSGLDDWIIQRMIVMDWLIRDKFLININLAKNLVKTYPRMIIWENKHDSFFGTINGHGENRLGIALMDIRGSLLKTHYFRNLINLADVPRKKKRNRGGRQFRKN